MTTESLRLSAATRSGVLWLALFLLPFAALAVHQWGWAPQASAGDWAQYLLHAKALVEGRPYAETGYIFHPSAWAIGPRAYPPGLPLTLVPIVAAAGVHSSLVRLLMLASVAVFAYLAWRRLSLDVPPWQAAVGAGFAALAIEAAWGTLAPISDPGFAALMWGMVLAADTTSTWTWRRILLITTLGGAALAYRIVGIALLAAFALHALVTWRRHGGRAAIPVAIWFAGGLLALAVGAVHVSDVATILTGLGGAISSPTLLMQQYRQALFAIVLYPSTNAGANLAYHVVAASFVVVGLVLLARRLWRSFLAVACVVYVIMLLISPVIEARYLWPLYPVGACAFAVGLTSVLERVRRSRPAFDAPRFALACMAVVGLAATTIECRRAPPRPLVGTPDAQQLFAWLRQTNSVAPMRIVFSNPRVVTLESGVPAMGNVERTAPGQLLAYAERRITHLIWQPDAMSDCLQKIANTLPSLYPTRFALAYENPSFRVYQVLSDATPVDSAFKTLTWREVDRC
ncbi:MAG: hypothetical protein ABI877_00980 [Gemmatimonadaceae bacterium]